MVSTWTPSCDKTRKDTTDEEGPCNHILFITKDLGKTFQQITSYVVQFAWGPDAKKDCVFFTAFRQKSGEQSPNICPHILILPFPHVSFYISSILNIVIPLGVPPALLKKRRRNFRLARAYYNKSRGLISAYAILN